MDQNLTIKKTDQILVEEIQPSFNIFNFAFINLAAIIGAAAAVYVLPLWIPNLSATILGEDPKFYWYLARGSAFTAYFLLWLSMVLGVGITNKLAAFWPGLPPAIDLHQFTSILGLVFAIFHGFILLGDHYINFKWVQILVPFATVNYKPVFVGFGQLGLNLLLILIISFYIRRKIGNKLWRLTHFLSFLMFLFALIHGITSGTDSNTPWAQGLYLITAAILTLMIIYRIIHSYLKVHREDTVH